MKKVVILGSTGTIGVNTLKVIDQFKDQFCIVGLTANNNVRLLEKQIKKYTPKYVAVGYKGAVHLKKSINVKKTKVLNLEDDLDDLVSHKQVDIVVIGMSGSAALKPFLKAVRCGKIVAPANKEALVIAGDIIMREAKKYGAKVIPIDSEQSAIFQCLEGQDRSELKKIHLTASGGALLNVSKKRFDHLSVDQILKHPRWKMGAKITVDSATLMNKGFEVIEAKRLFNLDMKEIHVVVHPEAIIHSMVEFIDGSIIAQLSITDMRLPIQYALTYPERLRTNLKSLNFFQLKQLNFEAPDFNKFPSLKLAFFVANKGGTLPSVLNAADEEAVDAFLNGNIAFSKIYSIVEKVVLKHKNIEKPTITKIIEADCWAREQAQKIIYN